MFDTVQAFEKQFEPVEDGYLYYPSAKSGGKLVTCDEYAKLREDWVSATWGKQFWLLMATFVFSILVLTLFSTAYPVPEWASSVVLYGLVGALMARFLWAARAPIRLVRGREDVTSPRSRDSQMKAARAQMPWRQLSLITLGSGIIFVVVALGGLNLIGDWLFLGVSGLFFGMSLWITYKKWGDDRD